MKDKMFQYYNDGEMIEDTGLLTEEEANELWNKYFDDAKEKLRDGHEIHMVIWGNAESDTDYDILEKEIDYRDCVVEKNIVVRIKKEVIN